MKILFPFVGDSFGGSHRSTIELYKNLRRRDIDAIILLHCQDGPLADFLLREGIPFQVVLVRSLAGEFPSVLRILFDLIRNTYFLGRFILRNDIDIVHGNDLRINLSWSIPTKLCRRKFVWHQRTILSSSIFWRLIPWLCDGFIAISQAVLRSTPKNVPLEMRELIFNPFDTDVCFDKNSARTFLENKHNIAKNILLIGYVGRLVPYKKIDFLIRSIAHLSKLCDFSFHFLVVGKGNDAYENELREIANSCGASDRITFAGFSHEPDWIIAGLDVLVASSNVDAFGRSLVEAMLQRTVVLASHASGHDEIIDNWETGVLFDPDDRDDFIDKLKVILLSRELRETMTLKAYKIVSERFSADNHAYRVLALYDRLTGNTA